MRKLLLLSLAVLLTLMSWAQRTVTGRVTDDKGNPLPNVSVLIKGSNRGVVTSADGSFSLNVPAEGKVLTFSAVGMAPREVTIGSQGSLNVALETADRSLQEVVVTSFNIQRDRKTLGYSTPVIKSEELTQARNTNVSNALVGKVAGIRVQGTGGSFTGSSILIRGNTSVTGTSQPLYVVDGLPIDNSGGGTALQNGTTTSNRAVDINPDDIESITVLKGAAATSSYGSRGAGGVILITTKKGRRQTKNSVELTSSYNTVEVNRLPDYQNQYAQGIGGIYVNNASSSWGPEIKGQTVKNYFGQDETLKAYPNNVSDLFQTGYNLQNTVSFSGGSEKTTYRASYGNATETFVISNNKFVRNNLTLNLSSDVSSKLNINSFINFNNTTSRRTQQGNQLSNPVFRAWFTPRSYDLTGAPYLNAAGNQDWYGSEDNPYWSIENVRYRDDVNRVFGNVGLRYTFTNWLNADVKVGTDFYSLQAHGFDEIGIRGGGNTSSQTTGGVLETRNTTRNFGSFATLNATRTFGDFKLLASVGNEIVQNYASTGSVTGVGLTVKGFDQMSNARTYTPTFGSSKQRTVGVFGDVVLDYKTWASLNLKARNDFVSTLPIDNNSVFYPAVALSINPTEIFPEIQSDWVNSIKLRANWGKVGRGPGPYNTDNYLATPNPADGFGPNIRFPFNNLIGYTIGNGAGNPNLKPEFTREWEVGTELALVKNRIILEANYYERKLTEGLFPVPYSAASGITTVFQNAGVMNTKGVELSLGLTPIKTDNFRWNINSNYTQFKTKVEELAPGVPLIFLAGFVTPNVRLVAGEEYGAIYGNKYERDGQGRMILNASGLPIPTSDVFKIGNPNPKYNIGITNNLSYKGFDFSVLVDIREGGDLYSRNLADLRRNGVVKETAEFPRFNADGTPNKPYMFDGVDRNGNKVSNPLTAEQYWGNTGKYVAAEGYIVNTSWVRIREANLTYRFPKTITDRLPFGNIELGVFGRNLFLWTKDFDHLDPEQNVLGISAAQGLEFNAQPSVRTIGVNLRVTL